ncbi:MAG: hypothetical protein KA165_16155, partial [Saprospiraceae bacterium]|nr:hypothetical protein [Saprospiraceae bacterium]
QETLALFCGMNLRDEIAQICLTALDGHFVETQDAARPDVFVYRALVESAKVQPQWALPLLDRAGRFLESKFDYELVECLGYIAANPNLTYAPEAAAILTKKLEARLSNAEITALLMALSANREGKTGELIAKYLDKITPNGLYELLRYDMRSVVSIIQQFNRAKLDGFIKTVEGKGDITMLLNIFRYAAQEEVKCNCAVALANLSKNKSFYNTLDASGEVTLSKAEEATYALFQDWSWEKYRPFGENGKKMLALLVHYLVWGYERGGVEFRNRIKTGNMANFLRFHFGTALSSKRMLNRFDDRLLANIPVKNLKSAWQRRNLIQFEGVCVIITLLAMVLVSPFFIYPSGYGKLLILFSILGLSFLILSDKVFKKDTPLGTSVAFLLFSYFSILEDFSNKWVDFVLGCLFAAMHTFFILDTNLSNPVKTLYLLFFYVLFISFNFLGKGLLYFILPPERLRDRLKDDEVKPQDPIPPTERYTDSGDYTYAMSA